jgi:hypothetical protein
MAARFQLVADCKDPGLLAPTGALSADGLDHYAMGMKDPEGNEFDIN